MIHKNVLTILLALLLWGCSAPPFLEVTSNDVAPGVRYSFFQNGDPNQIHVLTVDLEQKGVHLESARLKGLVHTSEIAAKTSTESSPVVAAVNADFFSFKTGWPVGIQMHDGEIWTALETRRSHLVVGSDGTIRFMQLTFDGEVKGTAGLRWKLDAVNQPVSARGSSLFSSRWIDSTNAFGFRLSAIDDLPGTGMKRYFVDSVAFFDKCALDDPSALLVFGKKALDSLGTNLPRLGDTLVVDPKLSPEAKNGKEILGGAGRLLVDGVPQLDENIKNERLAKDFIDRRHPRTFVGLDNRANRLFVCVVDGRQSKSVGMNFKEMADFLLFLGASDGFNFDGGGSSTMVVDGRIVNSPSDKSGERAVANAFVIRAAGIAK